MDGWPGFFGSIRWPPLPEPAPGMRPAGARGMGARADGAVRFSPGCPGSPQRAGSWPGLARLVISGKHQLRNVAAVRVYAAQMAGGP